jgi:hypothetical protein
VIQILASPLQFRFVTSTLSPMLDESTDRRIS